MADPVPVKMFWNAETMRSTVKDEELVSKLNVALKRHDNRFFLSEIHVCAKEDAIDASRRGKIATPQCPVTYIKPPETDTPAISDGCEDEFQPSFDADLILVKDVWMHALSHRGAVMLIVASDDNFSSVVGTLVSKGYTMLSAGEDKTAVVAEASSAYWLWEGMQQEDAPFMTRRT